MPNKNTPSIHNPPTETHRAGYYDARGRESAAFEWDGTAEQVRVVQGLAVAVSSETNTMYVAVTHVYDEKEKDAFRDVSESPWFQQVGDRSYRSLNWIDRADTDELDLDYVQTRSKAFGIYDDSPEIKPGDTVHVHQTYFWGTTSDNDRGRTGLQRDEVCLLPYENIGVESSLKKLSDLRFRVAQQLMRSAGVREHLTMLEHPRIDPNEPFRPFGEVELDEEKARLKTRRVYGAGQVDDHFVDIKAEIQRGTDEEIGGDLRFTTKGGVVITPQIAPLGEGTEDDPLMKVEVHIHSSTVHNRAVGEQQAYILIDGVKYVAEKDPEVSSQYFDNPGHDVYFAGFRPEGVSKNTFTLTEAQKQAYFDKGDDEHATTRDFINEMINKGKDPYSSNPEMNAELEQRIAQALAANAEQARILETIKDNPLDSDVNCGAPLVVPRSMLDSIQIVFPSVTDSE